MWTRSSLLIPLAGMVVVGLIVYGSLRVADFSPASDAETEAPGARAELVEAAFEGQHETVERALVEWLYSKKPGEADALLTEHGPLAARAYASLGEPGLSMLPAAGSMPNFRLFLDSPVALAASESLMPISAHLGEMARLDPARADTVFHTFTRMGEREARVLASHPQALPVLAVAPSPSPTAEVIERYGEEAISLMLRFEPDSYHSIAHLLAADGDRIFTMRDKLLSHGKDLVAERHDALEAFLVLYFVEHGQITPWLERQIGMEQSAFFISNNADYLKEAARRHGRDTVQAVMASLVDYARAEPESREHAVAEACFTVPGTFAIFTELRTMPSARDRFLESYANRGGVSLIAFGYDNALWPELVQAVDGAKQAEGNAVGSDALMVLLAVLAEHEPFHRALRFVLNNAPQGLDIAATLHALLAAMEDDGGPEASTFRMVQRTLQMILDNNIQDIPDDYLSRQVHWIWDILPGRDAFRLTRMVINGYSPTLWEQVNGVWDGVNIALFVYNVGGAVVDTTASVAAAIGEQSFSGLAQALGVVAKASAGEVMSRLIHTLQQPRNYVRLALSSGYFAYDAFLTYAPFDIPMGAELLEFNQKYLDESMRTMFFQVLRDVGTHALLWRPEFDHRDWQPIPPDMPDNLESLGEAGRIALALDKLDYRMKRAVVDLLNANDRRRNFTKMLGLGEDLFGEGQQQDWGFREGIEPRGPEAFPESERGESSADEEESSTEEEYEGPLGPPRQGMQDTSEEIRNPGGFELAPVAYFIVDGERQPLPTPRLRNLTAGERTSTIAGWTLEIPREIDAWHDLIHEESRFLAWTLEWIAEMATSGRS